MPRQPSVLNTGLFLGAVLLSTLGTWLLLRYRQSWGMDPPDQRRKLHEKPVPRLGGLPVFLTLAAGFGVMAGIFPTFLAQWSPVIITNCLIFAVGFADDLRPMGAKVKLLGQIGVACILFAMGISIDALSNPFGEGAWNLGWWSLPITLLWLVAIPNVVNLIDGMDGLATGFGMFLCLTLAFVGHFAGNPEVVTVSVIMGGALTGFLVFNFPPAKMFLGDGGAYLIGFFIASVSLFTSNKGSIIAALLVVIIALGVPILDTFFAIVRRAVRGVPILRADAEHIHHRLITLGFSKARALVAIYSVCLVLSIIGLSVFWKRGMTLPIAGAAVCLLGLGAARYLGYVKSWRDVRSQWHGALARRRDMLYAGTYGRMMEWEAERCATMEEFLPLLQLGIERLGLRTEAADGFAPVRIPLVTDLVCTIHHPVSEGEKERWMAKADLLAPALNLATERWGLLPGLDLESS